MSLQNTSGMTVNVTYPDATAPPSTPAVCSVPNRVRVDVYYPYTPFFHLPLNYSLHATAEGRFVYNPS